MLSAIQRILEFRVQVRGFRGLLDSGGSDSGGGDSNSGGGDSNSGDSGGDGNSGDSSGDPNNSGNSSDGLSMSVYLSDGNNQHSTRSKRKNQVTNKDLSEIPPSDGS